jgi:hypothetical protein
VNHVPPRCRSELIELIQRQAPSSVIRRACLTDQVEVLGGFHHALGDVPGWIVRVTSVSDREYLVAVVCQNHAFDVLEIDRVPWCEWAGAEVPYPEQSSLTNGDHPHTYMRKWSETLCHDPI